MGYALFNAIGSPAPTVRVRESDGERQKPWDILACRNHSSAIVETRLPQQQGAPLRGDSRGFL